MFAYFPFLLDLFAGRVVAHSYLFDKHANKSAKRVSRRVLWISNSFYKRAKNWRTLIMDEAISRTSVKYKGCLGRKIRRFAFDQTPRGRLNVTAITCSIGTGGCIVSKSDGTLNGTKSYMHKKCYFIYGVKAHLLASLKCFYLFRTFAKSFFWKYIDTRLFAECMGKDYIMRWFNFWPFRCERSICALGMRT